MPIPRSVRSLGRGYNPADMPTTLPVARRRCLAIAIMIVTAGCSGSDPAPSNSRASAGESKAVPPPEIRAWMDRLTVAHEYDPRTGFIVAKETVSLPPLLADAPPLDVAVAKAGAGVGVGVGVGVGGGAERIVIAFATADRCAPCQQFKRDAMNDAAVIARLSDPRFLPTHIEVDRSPELAQSILGTRAIPMTHALRGGKVIATLRGQRSAADVLAWLDSLP